MGLPQDHGMANFLSETNLPYPAQTKQTVGEINGIVTDVTSISFSDRIMVTITQDGRLAQWVNLSLSFPKHCQYLQNVSSRYMFPSPPKTPPK
jgi:hypothetical protein